MVVFMTIARGYARMDISSRAAPVCIAFQGPTYREDYFLAVLCALLERFRTKQLQHQYQVVITVQAIPFHLKGAHSVNAI